MNVTPKIRSGRLPVAAPGRKATQAANRLTQGDAGGCAVCHFPDRQLVLPGHCHADDDGQNEAPIVDTTRTQCRQGEDFSGVIQVVAQLCDEQECLRTHKRADRDVEPKVVNLGWVNLLSSGGTRADRQPHEECHS